MSESTCPLLPPPLLEFIETRGIPESRAVEAGLELVDGSDAAARLGLAAALVGSCILIPYPGTDYLRVRVLDKEANAGVRYFCPKGREVPVYVPNGMASAGDLVVVESPIKALALQSHGIDAVGLGGIGTTLDDRGELNASWTDIAVPGRKVVVLPDGNIWNNPAVLRDTARLAKALRRAGCEVRIALLPKRYENHGPDDVVASDGAAPIVAAVGEALDADPLKRLTEAKDPTELLEDFIFLATLHYESIATQTKVRAAAKKSVGARALDAALKDFVRQVEQTRPDEAGDTTDADKDFFVEDGRIMQRTPLGTSRVVVHGTVEIKTEVVFLDAPWSERTFELAATLPDGSPLGTAEATVSQLMQPAALVKLFGARLRVDVAPPVALQAIQTISPQPIPHSYMASRLGFLRHHDGLAYVTTDGVINATDITVDVPPTLGRYRFGTATANLAHAAETALQFFALAPTPGVGTACLAAVALAIVGHFAPVDFALMFTGRTGRRKSTVAALVLSHFGRFTYRDLPATFESTRAALELLVHTAGDVVLAIDDFVPRRPDDEVIKKAQALAQALGNRAQRSVLTRDRELSNGREPRAMVLITGEQRIEGASVNARLFEVPFGNIDLNLDVLSAIQADSGALPAIGKAIVEWTIVHSPWLADALAARTARYETHYGKLADLAHSRLRGQLAQLLLGVSVYLEVLVARGVVSVERAAEAFRDAQIGLLELAGAQRSKQAAADPVVLFCERLEDLLATRPDLFPMMKDPPSDPRNVLGFRRDDDLHLIPSSAFHFVSRHAGAYMKQADIYRGLVERGIAAPPEPGREYDRKQTLPGLGRPRVVTVSITKLHVAAHHAPPTDALAPMDFEPLGLRRDPQALATYVYAHDCGTYEAFDGTSASYLVSLAELEEFLASANKFWNFVVWAEARDPVWNLVPSHRFDARAALRFLGHDVERLDKLVGRHLSDGQFVDALREAWRESRHDLRSPTTLDALGRATRATGIYTGIANTGFPIDVAAARALRDRLRDELAKHSGLPELSPEAGSPSDAPAEGHTSSTPADVAHGSGLGRLKYLVRCLDNLLRAESDGRVQYRLDLVGTSTGRLTAAPSEVLGLPREGGIRACVATSPGNVIQSFDCRAFEAVVLAALADETALLDAVRDRRDPYEVIARAILDEKTLKAPRPPRDAGKAFFKKWAYGSGKREIAQELTELGYSASFEDVTAMEERMDAEFPHLAKYRQRILRDDNAVRSRLGRRPPKDTLGARTKRLNFPVQATACEVFDAWVCGVVDALQGCATRVILPFHDAILTEGPEAEVDVARAVVEAELERALRTVLSVDLPGLVSVEVGATMAFDRADEERSRYLGASAMSPAQVDDDDDDDEDEVEP